MSADNIIYIKKKNKYHVWEDSASVESPTYKGKKTHKKFKYEYDAHTYAHELQKEFETEYGVKILEDESCACGGNCSCQG
jgi:hypothetical protein